MFIDRAISGNTANPKLWDFRAALLRRLGRLADAKAAITAALVLDPLDFWARNEQALCRQAAALAEDRAFGLQELERLMRGEVQSYLELSADYAQCGLWDDAIDVLERYVRRAADKARVDPMVHYHLAWLYERAKSPQKAQEHYRLTGRMPPDYCFPFRLESIDVVQSAMKANPRDVRAAYYLGNLLYDLQSERAIAAWEQSRGLDPEFATVHRNLGFAYAQTKSDLGRAVGSLEKAVACDPRDPKLYAELDAMYEASGAAPEKRYSLMSTNHATVAQRDDALLREIRLASLLGHFDRAIDLIEHHHFHSWEGEGGVHDVYADAYLGRARKLSRQGRHQEALDDCEAALKHPENLESARAHRSARQVQIYYLMGKARAAMGDPTRARQCFQQSVAAYSDKADPQFRYWYALACRELGDEPRAQQALESLTQSGREMLAKGPPVDFFSKFGSRQSPIAHQASAHYLLGLAHLGQRRTSDAKHEFHEAVRIDASHFGARMMGAELHD